MNSNIINQNVTEQNINYIPKSEIHPYSPINIFKLNYASYYEAYNTNSEYINMIEYNHRMYVNRVLIASYNKNNNMKVLPKYNLVDILLQSNFHKKIIDYCNIKNIYYY